MISQKSHRVSHARRVHQPCHPPVARSGKVGHLGTLVGLLASLGLAGLAGLPAGAVDPTSPTGTDNTQDRSLTIWAKDSVTVALDPTDPQTSFQPDPKGDALQAAGETHKFKITKITLTGSQTLATVDPSRPATFTAGAVAYVSTDLSTPDNKAVINFSNPVALTDGSGHVKVTAGEVSDDDGATFGPDTTNPLDVFIDTVGTDKTSDGMYIVEEFEGANLKPWAAVIEIPTYTSSQLDTLTTPAPGTINYDIALYAKVKTAITPSFNSYVDILDKPASASGATLVVGRGTGAGADPDTWETIGITKGSTHTFTASFIINGYNRPANTGGVFIGLSDFEMDPNCTITTRREGQNRAPYVVVNSSCVVANKELTTNDNIEFGVLIRNLDDPTLTQYFALYNQAKSAIGQNGSCGGSQLVAPGNVYGFCRIANSSKGGVISQGSYMQFGIPSEAIGPTNPNTGQSSIYEAVALALGATTMTSAVGSPAITNAGDLRTLAGVDISAMNTNHYSSAEEIFGLTSNLQIEITFSQRSRVTGSAFTAGNTSTVNVKPFLYGATNGYATSATVAEDDIFSWEPTVNPPTASDTAAYIGKHFTKRVGQYGY
ncbi:MAG: hypothetical protein LBG70_01960, partial [Bifidobacteriaceae bacterium]|nr:hypothetical protein [Bifidobacteriaceae bacterium]